MSRYVSVFLALMGATAHLLRGNDTAVSLPLSGSICSETQITKEYDDVRFIKLLFTQEPLPVVLIKKMIGRSWSSDCPVHLKDLRYLTIPHWGYDDELHFGHMVVHYKIADEILAIFKEIFMGRFPIEKMEVIDSYGADDEASMSANNSSAFCFRRNVTKPAHLSNHGYGVAIDINPLYNPYHREKDNFVAPQTGRPYLDRKKTFKGMITDAENNVCYQAFKKRGYRWGGHFKGRKDYHHFDKDPKELGLVKQEKC